MDQNWIWHNSYELYFRNPFGAVACNQLIELKLKVRASDGVEALFIKYIINEGEEQQMPLEELENQGDETVYRVILKAPQNPGLLWYYFIVHINGNCYYYGNNPNCRGGLGVIYDKIPPAYQVTVFKEGATTPNWFKDAVMYQIFVDRFYNGNSDGQALNPKKNSLIHTQWDDDPLYIFDKKTDDIARWSFFGGNLPGVRKKLSYLKSLGVNLIYFNPIFEAPSNHKYDTGDYHKIDPMFGDNEVFQELCTEAAEMGISVILDGVFSHTGSDSLYFNKKGNYDSLGAYQSKESPYYKWYRFQSYPEKYESWWGINTLPNVEELEPTYQDFIIFNENSVLKTWLSKGAIGWRLDVVDELPDQFVKNFSRTLKEVNPKAILIGEVWEDASNKESYGKKREYLLGDELDSAMNYPFRNLLLSFISGQMSSEDTKNSLMSLYENYPKHHFYSMMNLLGSHDVPRALTVLKEALPTNFADSVKNDIGIKRLKLLSLWQMTFPGVPCVYYGDEAGVEGGTDPLNRRTYPWGKENTELLNWYKNIIALRNHYDVLKTGHWQPLVAEGDVYGFVRFIDKGEDIFGQKKKDNVAIVLFNRSIDSSFNLSLDVSPWCQGTVVDVLQDYTEIHLENGRLNINLGALEGKVFLQDRWGSNLEDKRECGILLHPTSLPSDYGIGDLGKGAFEFADFLAQSKQKLWQILPLNPPGCGESPYQCYSAFAGNPLLIDPEALLQDGLLTAEDMSGLPAFDQNRVNFDVVKEYKGNLLKKAFDKFKTLPLVGEYENFTTTNSAWLDDYALYMALKKYFNDVAWNLWEGSIRDREPKAIEYYRDLLKEDIQYHKFLQFKFFSQWQKLKDYVNGIGIKIVGDLPIFVSQDSSDVWVAPQLFKLNETGCPLHIAGVPPDYFCETGQCWGNPIYQWDEMAKDDYKWWQERFKTLYGLVDIIRIDHFRGFEDYWEIPGEETTGVNGKWVKGPGEEFFATMQKHLGNLPVIAEDLGFITPEVQELRTKFGYPGMKIMQFEMEAGGFKLPMSEKNTVVYTGTHDNDTLLGWHNKRQDADSEDICWRYIEMAYRCDSATAIIPLQDILCLDSDARMNTPGTVEGNWLWRYTKDQLTPGMAGKLSSLAEKYKR